MPTRITSTLRILFLAPQDVQEPGGIRDKESVELTTRYYSATIPLWRDNLPLAPSELETWEKEWSTEEASEVVEAIGAWIIYVTSPHEIKSLDNIRNALSTIQRTVDRHLSSSNVALDPLFILLVGPAMKAPSVGLEGIEWETLGMETGSWEFIDSSLGSFICQEDGGMKGCIDEDGGKVGLPRLREALEAHIWNAGGSRQDQNPDFAEIEEALLLDQTEINDAGVALSDLRKGLLTEQCPLEGEAEAATGSDREVQSLDSMMAEMQAVKDMIANLPLDERRKVAARAVSGVLKSL